MVVRRFKVRPFGKGRAWIVEKPLFAGFEAADDRVAGGAGMRRGVLRRRRIATPDVAALGASAKMQPPPSAGQALNAAGPAGWNRHFDSRYGVHAASPRIQMNLAQHNPTLGEHPYAGSCHRGNRPGSTSRPARSHFPVYDPSTAVPVSLTRSNRGGRRFSLVVGIVSRLYVGRAIAG
jgi:hypothetical protein